MRFGIGKSSDRHRPRTLCPSLPGYRMAEYVVPAQLAAALREGRLVVFVASGFSRAAGLPSWEGLLRTVATTSGVSWDTLPAVEYSSHDSMDRLQWEIFRRSGREEALAVMCQELCGRTSEEMTQRLDALFALPVAAVVTSNWDDCLDARCELTTSPETVLRATTLRARHGTRKPPLFKLQGDLRAVSSVVLDEADYARVKPARDAFLKRLFVDTPGVVVLHLGAGIDSGGALGAIRAALTGQERHFAIAPDGSPAQHAVARQQGIRLLAYRSEDGHTTSICKWLGALSRAAGVA